MSKRQYANYTNSQKRSRSSLVTGYNRATGGLTAQSRQKATLQRAVTAAVKKTVEKKGCDFPIAFPAVPATTNSNAAAICLNLLQMGAGSWNRVGRKVHLQSLRVRGEIVWLLDQEATTLNYNGNTIRMVIVWDKQPSGGSIPTFDTIFGNTGQDGSEATTYLNPVKYDNMDRFSVLRDCVHTFVPPMYNPAAGTQNAVISRRPFDEFIQLKGREVVFSGQSNPMTIADISTGAIYIFYRAAENVTNTNQIAITSASYARLRYIDI